MITGVKFSINDFVSNLKASVRDLFSSYNFLLLSTAAIVTTIVWYFGINLATMLTLLVYLPTIGFIGARYYS